MSNPLIPGAIDGLIIARLIVANYSHNELPDVITAAQQMLTQIDDEISKLESMAQNKSACIICASRILINLRD